MADPLMTECCFSYKKGSGIHRETKENDAEQIVVDCIREDNNKSRSSTYFLPIETVRKNTTTWVEKRSKRQLKDLVESFVNFVEDSCKSAADDESVPKLADFAHIDSELLAKTHSFKPISQPNSRNVQLHQIKGSFSGRSTLAADDRIDLTEIDYIFRSESKAIEISDQSMEANKTRCEVNTSAGDEPFRAILQLEDSAPRVDWKYFEPSSTLIKAVTNFETNSHLNRGGGGHKIYAPHGNRKEFELPRYKDAPKPTTADTLEVRFCCPPEHRPADHDGTSKSFGITEAAAGGSLKSTELNSPRSMRSSIKSKKNGLSSSRGEKADEINSSGGDGKHRNPDHVTSSLPNCVQQSPSVKAKRRRKNRCLSGSREGDDSHEMERLDRDENTMKRDDVASGVPNSSERSSPCVRFKKKLMKNRSDSSAGEIVAADGILAELEENAGEYSIPKALKLGSVTTTTEVSKKYHSSVRGHTGETANERNSSTADGMVREHGLVSFDTSRSNICEPSRQVNVKKHKKKTSHSNTASTYEFPQRWNNPAVDDFIREYKKGFACDGIKAVDSIHPTEVNKIKKKRHCDVQSKVHQKISSSADCRCPKSSQSPRPVKIKKLKSDCHSSRRPLVEVQEKISYSADYVVQELGGAAVGYPKSFQLPPPVETKKLRKNCHHESGGENVDENRNTAADLVGLQLNGYSCGRSNSSEELRTKKVQRIKQNQAVRRSSSGVEKALHGDGVPALDGAVIVLDSYSCGDSETSESSPFKAKKFGTIRRRDSTGDCGHAITVDAHDGTDKNLKIYRSCLDPQVRQTRSITRERNKLMKNGFFDGAGEIALMGEVVKIEEDFFEPENGVIDDVGSPISRKELKGSMRRHKPPPGNDINHPLESDGDQCQQFDFQDESPPLFFIPSKQEKKKVRFSLPEEGCAVEGDEKERNHSWRYDRNMPGIQSRTVTQEEDDNPIKAANDYIEERDGHEAPGILKTSDNTEALGDLLDLAKDLPPNPVKLMNSKVHSLMEGGNGVKWTDEEEEQLRRLLLQYGRDWKRIGRILDRPSQVCKEKWRSLRLDGERKTGLWKQEELDQLKTYVLQILEAKQKLAKKEVDRSQWRQKDVNWETISEIMNRGVKACIFVWYTKICPSLVDEKSEAKSFSPTTVSFPKSALKKQSSFR